MSDRAAVRWTATRCGCMQTVLTPLRERGTSPVADVGMNATMALADRTAPACIDAWLPWGKTSVVFPSRISPDETHNLLCQPLLLLNCFFLFFLNAHNDTFYDVQTEKHARLFLAFSIWVCLVFFFFFGWEREVMFEFKNGNENNHCCRVSNTKRSGQTEINHIWLCVNAGGGVALLMQELQWVWNLHTVGENTQKQIEERHTYCKNEQ